MSDTSVVDPYAAPTPPGGLSTLTDVAPLGTEINVNDDGTADVMDPSEHVGIENTEHFANLAEHLDDARLNAIAVDLLEAIEMDKEARAARDRQYEEGLNRTGMGDNTPGGADFPGASRAVHPLLLESSIDFAAGVMNEMLPPDGPVKATTTGDQTDAKDDRAKRVARYMNWQLTEQMTSAYHEFEVGFTQCPLGGAFYTKTYLDGVIPAISFIPCDHVYRPWSDGDFYSQPRITHAQSVDKWTYKDNIRKGLWIEVVDPDASPADIPEESAAEQANDRIVGRSSPSENVDGIRLVFESSVIMGLEDDDDETLPYLVTIDVEARKITAIYRNWREVDKDKTRLPFLIEWPFWPWRGGYPVGLTHMIGSLTGAATGSLRALLDAAHLNNSQTGVRLKGGSSSGGQNITPRVTEINEIQGSLSQDDVRKTFMPLEFNPPSPTLFQLLTFLVDAGRGVVRTTFDEFNQMNGETPVGTAQMMIEQGLKNFGSIHARLHRSMRLLLKGLYNINGDTLTAQTIIDQQGELTVQPGDFQGPMVVIPVSDPRIFSDIQRKAMAMTIAGRAAMFPQLYNLRKSEENFLKQYGVTNPDQFMVPDPQPVRTTAVAENVAASNSGPIKAFPGQDHEAHITNHLAYLRSPIFGSNPSLAVKFIPIIINHLGEHLSLWYSDAMTEAATSALRTKTGDPNLTVQSFVMEGTEVPLDRLMAQLDDSVLQIAGQKLKDVPAAIQEARDLLKSLAPPQPMDPSMVAQDDVQRQRDADKAQNKFKLIDLQSKRQQAQDKLDLDAHKTNTMAALKMREMELRAGNDDQKAEADKLKLQIDSMEAEARAYNDREANQNDLTMNEQDNETALEITGKEIAAGKGSRLKTGTGEDPGNRA